MQKWLDSVAGLLHGTGSGVDPENLSDCMQDLEEVVAQEKNFTAGFEELKTLDPLLVDYIDAAVMSELREMIQSMQVKKTELKHEVDAYREVLQRYVLLLLLEYKPSRTFDLKFSRFLCWICQQLNVFSQVWCSLGVLSI